MSKTPSERRVIRATMAWHTWISKGHTISTASFIALNMLIDRMSKACAAHDEAKPRRKRK